MPKEMFKVEKPAGINRLRDSVQEDPAVWQDSFNARFQHGISKKIEGYEEGLGKALVDPDIIVPLRDDSGDYYWWAYVGTNKDTITATATATQTGGVIDNPMTITNGGAEYFSPPSVIITGATAGTGAEAVVTLTDGVVTLIQVSPQGVDYDDPVTVVIDPPESTKFFRITSANAHVDVTPDNFYVPTSGRAYQWTGDTMNGIPYLTNGVPYYYNEDIGKFQAFDNIPRAEVGNPGDVDYDPNGGDPRVRFQVMRSYRNFMVGMDIDTDSYGGYFDSDENVDPQQNWGGWPDGVHQTAVWWSHFVINKDIDPEDSFNQSGRWEDANPVLSSGWNFLGGVGGPIIDGRVLKDSFMIYRERAVWQMSYVGGVQIFNFKEVFNDVGCLGLDCTLEVDGQHIVVGQSDVYMHNGVKKQTLADGIVRRELFAAIHADYTANVFIAGDYKNKEAWICIPSADSETILSEGNINPEYLGTCNLAYVFNWTESTWSKRDLPWITSSAFTILSLAEEDISWDAITEGGHVDGGNSAGDPSGYTDGVSWEELDLGETWANAFFQYNPSEWGLIMTSNTKNIFTQTPYKSLISFTNYDLNGYRNMGDWDASTNIPDLTAIPLLSTLVGDYWTVSVDGTTDLSDGVVTEPVDAQVLDDWSAGDIVLYDVALDSFNYTGFRKSPEIQIIKNFETEFEKTHMDMGERMITKFVSRVYPLVRNGVLDVWMAESMSLEEGVVWEYKGTFDPTQDDHIAVRVTGRYVHVKFIIPKASRAEVRGYWLEYEMIGRR